MILRRWTLVLALIIWLPFFLRPTQSRGQAAAQAPANQSTYTFHANTHVVLTDVTVTDANGNPVHGLPESAFHIFDNKQPQDIASFEEHSGLPAATILPASTHGIYIANIDMADQMYLNYQLTRFLNEQPQRQPLAIYLRAGSGCFLVQDFTSDRKLLLDAVHKSIPRFPPPGREYLSDFDTLHQMVVSLSQLPGRKNVLWFSGGSTLFLIPDAIPLQNDAAWRELYDDLDQERIAIYPIDARGLKVTFSPMMALATGQQQMMMEDEAKATGGKAFYNNNALKEITEHILDSDGSFYTLTYSPHNLHLNNKWHKVRVELSGASYHLSYRTGYFADGSIRDTDQPGRSRTRLLVNGEKLETTDLSSHPIIFQASIHPASDPSVGNLEKPTGSLTPPSAKKGAVLFSIRYTVPIGALTIRTVNGRHQLIFGVAAVALNRDGRRVARKADQITMTLNEEVFRRSPNLPIVLDEQLNLAKDDKFLYLGVWDTSSGRFGSIEIPLEVPKPSKHEKAAGRG
jgi:VWFA-related protein